MLEGLRQIVWVAHTHWDREWYRPFESFRARLVDTVDALIALLGTDPAYRFLLDGQCVVLEDYLALRPGAEPLLRELIGSGRLAVGPWYVQPDCLLPHGESHIRNLLLGQAIAARYGRVARVAYTPDSFGHPAQFPQLFAGFGLEGFVFWRGSGNEAQRLGPEFRWHAPDGSAVTACLLWRGYSNAALLPRDADTAVGMLGGVVAELAARTRQGVVLLMNGIDHAAADPESPALAQRLQQRLGIPVRMGLLEDFLDSLRGELPAWRGRLDGARLAPLLPGVWSSRMPLKLLNHDCESALLQAAEPWAALGRVLGLADERPALELAWRELLKNQAHDSLGGCSIDTVHADMLGRYAASRGLALETAQRAMERIAGLPPGRETPLGEVLRIAVFNASPRPHSAVVRLALDAHPVLPATAGGALYHPVLAANAPHAGFTVDGQPARVIDTPLAGRFISREQARPLAIEFMAADLPACGMRVFELRAAPECAEHWDQGTRIANEAFALEVDRDTGGVRLQGAGIVREGLFRLEHCADRGDSYDGDPLGEARVLLPERVALRRLLHAGGLQYLELKLEFLVSAGLDEARTAALAARVPLQLVLNFRLAPGLRELDVELELDNRAHDQRLRLLFPAAGAAPRWHAAGMLDTEARSAPAADDAHWLHRAPPAFAHQGWVCVNGLSVVAPGLPEAEVRADGTLAVTLLRSTGWLSRADLRTRAGPAGPALAVPGAQCVGPLRARLVLFEGLDAAHAAYCLAPVAAVFGGEQPLWPPGRSLLALREGRLVMSCLKPAADGAGLILRLCNHDDVEQRDELRVGFAIADAWRVDLAEREIERLLPTHDGRLPLRVAAHAWLSLRIDPAPR